MLAVHTKSPNKSEEVQVEGAQIFETIQGEGVHTGTPSFFLRLQGCSVKCKFCDEKQTWSHTDTFKSEYSVNKIIEQLEKMNPRLKHITITGGEPTEQELNKLITELMDRGFKVAIETAATGDYVSDLFQDYARDLWVTFSPKEIYAQRLENGIAKDKRIWNQCSELKFVIASEEAENYLINTIIPKLDEAGNDCPIFLVPNWYEFELNQTRAIKLCEYRPQRLKLGLQMHKYLNMP